MFVAGWVKSKEEAMHRDEALQRIVAVGNALQHNVDSLKREVARYRSDSIKAAARMLNARRATDSSFVVLDTVDKALQGQVPDSLIEMFRRGIDGLRTHVVEERVATDTMLAVTGTARAVAVDLANTEGKQVDNLKEEVRVIQTRPPFFLRLLKGTTRLVLVGGAAGVGAKVGGPVGAVVGAVIGYVVPTG